MCERALFFLLLVSYVFVAGAKTPCKLEDSPCITQAVNDVFKTVIDGIPDKVKTSDPLEIKEVKVDLSDLKYTLTNSKLTGIRDCMVKLLKLDVPKNTFEYDLDCSRITLEGEYEINGKLAGIPIEGKGKYSYESEVTSIHFTGNYGVSKVDGKNDYLRATKYEATLEPRGDIKYELKNLFNGDQEKAATVKKFIDENKNVVDEMLRPPAASIILGEYMKNINSYMDLVPVEELLAM